MSMILMYKIIFVQIRLLIGSRRHVSWTAKIIRLTTLFSDSKHFFVQLLSWPLAGQTLQLMQCTTILSVIKVSNIFIVHNIL